MPRLVVRHDQPIAEAIDGKRSDLDVVAAGSNAEAIEALADADLFVTNPTSWEDDILKGLESGNWVQATSAGYAAFPIEEFESRGIAFTNAGGNYGPPVADHAMALLLGLARKIHVSSLDQHRREWNREIGTDLLDLEGQTLTVAGMGDIGEEVARRGQAFGMAVQGTKQTPKTYDGVVASDRIYRSDALPELLPETDVLVLAVPLTEETHHLVDADAFGALPDSALLINVARGPVVDETALIEALESDAIAGAGLDVFETEPLPEESPLWGFENAILTPHVGGRSNSFVARFVDLFLANYDRWQGGDDLKNRIV